MVSLHNFIILFFCVSTIFNNTIFSQQLYDTTTCSSNSPTSSASTYLCTSKDQTCKAYVIYKAQPEFQWISSISSLFNLTGKSTTTHLLQLNRMTEDDSRLNLKIGQEIIVPVTCSCYGRYFQADFVYNNSKSYSISEVACRVFEGLVKPMSLEEENPNYEDSRGDLFLKVPIQCACPDKNQTIKGVSSLVTYPVVDNDKLDVIARKFGVSSVAICEANKLAQYATIFAGTTLLVPVMEDTLVVNSNPLAEDSSPPIVSTSYRKINNDSELSLRVFILVGVLVVVVIVTLAILFCMWTKNSLRSFQPLSPKTTMSSFNFSPDFLDGMSKLRKHSIVNFSFDELRIATDDFDETYKIGTSVYRGKYGGGYMAIEEFKSEDDAQHVVSILTKINHLNIVKLEGCCYDIRKPYLVFEFTENGSLRDCLSMKETARKLNWGRRIQIAFDLAMGLHYIHYSTKPSFVHRNINSRNVLVTKDWRAKISGFRLAKPLNCSEENIESIEWSDSVNIVGIKEYMAPEYIAHGLGSVKVDVFAFGVVLLELISSKDVVIEGKLLNEYIDFLDDGSNWLERLNELMDPCLGEDYPMGDALCLALLAKACVQQDPHCRPTMNDLLKAISRIL